jgi:hypothetical protein
MHAPRRIETEWPQTQQMERRAERQRDHAYRRKPQREPINWPRCLMLAGAGFLVLVVWIYKLTGPM